MFWPSDTITVGGTAATIAAISSRTSMTLQSPEERLSQVGSPGAPPGLDGGPFALRVEQSMHSFVEPTPGRQGPQDESNPR